VADDADASSRYDVEGPERNKMKAQVKKLKRKRRG